MHIDPGANAAMLSAARRASRRTPWAALLNALLELAGNQAELLSHAERAWASVTFSGTRHDVRLRFAGARAVSMGEQFIDALPDHEFAIPRQLVADAAVLSVIHTALPEPCLEVEVQLLLLEDA
jgi:hypothetical protein